MGRKNRELCWYLGKPEVFADFCNGCIYGGRKVIFPDELAEAQRDYAGKKRGKDGRLHTGERERDVIKLLCRNRHFVKIALENQDKIHYGMPLRCGEYDMMEIGKQARHLREQYRKERTLKGGEEFLSGMKKTDRLIPVVTIVFYHGKGEWRAARQLREMLDMEGMDGELEKLAANYRMNVVCVEELEETRFRTGLRELVGLLKRRGNKEAFWKYCQENGERIGHLDADTYDVICTMLQFPLLSQKKEKCKNKEREDFNMCQALQELVRDGEKRGEKWGEKRGEKQGEEKLGDLIVKLLQDGRQEDALRASRYISVRKKLYAEYGIV